MEILEEHFYKDGLHFECQRCSFCCGHSPGFVYLSLRDLTTLCNHFKMSVKSFVEKYCRWADYYYGTQVLSLKEMKNYDCILWNQGCSAYEARPIQCSTYPFWSWMLADKETWEDCAKDCPGMQKIQGKPEKIWPVELIEKNKKMYTENVPLHKDEVMELIRKEEEKAEDNLEKN